MASKKLYKKKDLKKTAVHQRILIYCLLVYIPFFILLNLLRLWGFGFALSDLGVFAQSIHNTAQGNFFQTSIKYPFHPDSNWLAFHFMPLPILFGAMFYYVFPHIETLSFIHVTLVSLTAFVVYRTCLKLGLNSAWSLFWAIIYLTNVMTIYHVLFSYEEATFAVPLFALATYFVISRNLSGLLACCLLLALTKEQYGLTIGGFGLLWALYHKSYRQGLLIAFGGGIIFLLVMLVIIPELSPYQTHFMLSQDSDTYNYSRYRWLMESPPEVLAAVPGKIFNIMNGRYILGLLLPLLLLPLGAIIFLLPILPDIIITILSTGNQQKLYIYYYSAPLVPVLITASAITLNKFKRKRNIAGLLLTANIICVVLALKNPVSKLSYLADPGMDWAYGLQFQKALSSVPEDAWLIVDEQSAAMASTRRRISPIEQETVHKADYALVRLSPYKYGPFNDFAENDALILAEFIKKTNEWGLVYWQYPYAIFKRGSSDIVTPDAMNSVIEKYSKFIEENKN